MSLLSVVEAGHCERNLQLDYDEEVFIAARKELYDHARSTDDRPFLLHVSFTQPHNPFVAGRKYWDMYEGRDIPEPEVPHIPYEDRDPWSQRYFMTIRQDEFEITPEQLYNARRGYFAMVTHIDELVGGLVETLESIGQLDNTYILFISDHGEMLGERGMWFKFNPYEASVRVPMILQGPGVRAGHKEDALASLVDLMPTFTGIASEGGFDGYAAPIDGKSLLDRPAPGSAEDRVYIESTGESLYGPAFILVEGRKKLVHTRTDPKMFFDLDADPLELTNLAEAPEHQGQIEAMFAAMTARWDEAGAGGAHPRLAAQAPVRSGCHEARTLPDLGFRTRLRPRQGLCPRRHRPQHDGDKAARAVPLRAGDAASVSEGREELAAATRKADIVRHSAGGRLGIVQAPLSRETAVRLGDKGTGIEAHQSAIAHPTLVDISAQHSPARAVSRRFRTSAYSVSSARSVLSSGSRSRSKSCLMFPPGTRSACAARRASCARHCCSPKRHHRASRGDPLPPC